MSAEDQAQALELAEWERNNASRSVDPFNYAPGDPKYGPAQCQECDEDMPVCRREYGFRLCVPCTEESERLLRLRR